MTSSWPGPDPAIHGPGAVSRRFPVDARIKSGHDDDITITASCKVNSLRIDRAGPGPGLQSAEADFRTA